tara:strand:+ start:2657 stop:2923 length:267 start_codon:yes stop_codon:yes gene_type:complete
MSELKTILQQITEDFPDDTFLYPTGYEDCVVGLQYASDVLIMDSNKIINKIIVEDGLSEVDAIEYFDYNIAGAGGDGFPIYVYIPEEE